MLEKFELEKGRVSSRIEQHNYRSQFDTSITPIIISGSQAKPVGMYGYYTREGNELTFSGFGSRDKEGKPINGRIGGDGGKTTEEGKQAAYGACNNFLNNLAIACGGDLDGVKHIAITVYVNADKDFKEHPKVADGASQLLLDVFGNFVGKPIRTALGTSGLPNDMSVEITGKVTITMELTAKLDLLDAKQFAKNLNIITENLIRSKSPYPDHVQPEEIHYKHDTKNLLQAKEFKQVYLKQLELYANDTLKELNSLEDGKDRTLVALARISDRLGTSVIDKQDVIDLICSEAQNLNLNIGISGAKGRGQHER